MGHRLSGARIEKRRLFCAAGKGLREIVWAISRYRLRFTGCGSVVCRVFVESPFGDD